MIQTQLKNIKSTAVTADQTAKFFQNLSNLKNLPTLSNPINPETKTDNPVALKSDECSKRCRQKVKNQFTRLKGLLQDYYLQTQLEKDAANSWTRFQLVAHAIAYIKLLRRKYMLPCAPHSNEDISADIELELIKAGERDNNNRSNSPNSTSGHSSKSNTSSDNENERNKENLVNGTGSLEKNSSNWKSCAAYRSRLNKSLKMLRDLLDKHSTLIAASRSASRAGLLDATCDYIEQFIRGYYSKESQILNRQGQINNPAKKITALQQPNLPNLIKKQQVHIQQQNQNSLLLAEKERQMTLEMQYRLQQQLSHFQKNPLMALRSQNFAQTHNLNPNPVPNNNNNNLQNRILQHQKLMIERANLAYLAAKQSSQLQNQKISPPSQNLKRKLEIAPKDISSSPELSPTKIIKKEESESYEVDIESVDNFKEVKPQNCSSPIPNQQVKIWRPYL